MVLALMIAVAITIVFLALMLAIPVTITVVISLTFTLTKSPLSIRGPWMFAVYSTVISIPEALKEPLSIVTRRDPSSSKVWRLSPKPVVPAIMLSDRVPITFDPDEIRARAGRPIGHDPGWRRCANPDTDTDLSCCEDR